MTPPLPFNRSKNFRVRLQASYAGSYTLPAIYCEAMYDTGVRTKTVLVTGKTVLVSFRIEHKLLANAFALIIQILKRKYKNKPAH